MIFGADGGSFREKDGRNAGARLMGALDGILMGRLASSSGVEWIV